MGGKIVRVHSAFEATYFLSEDDEESMVICQASTWLQLSGFTDEGGRVDSESGRLSQENSVTNNFIVCFVSGVRLREILGAIGRQMTN